MNKIILFILVCFSVNTFVFSQGSLKWVVEGSLHSSIETRGVSYSFEESNINNVNYDQGIDPFLWGYVIIRTSSGVLDSADFEVLVDDLQVANGQDFQLMIYSADSSMDLQTQFGNTPLTQRVRLQFNLFKYGSRTNVNYMAGSGGTPQSMSIGFSGPNENTTNVNRLHTAEIYYIENPIISGAIPCVVVDHCSQIDTFVVGQAFSDINTTGEDIDATILSQAKTNATYPYDVTGGRTYIHTMEAQNTCDNGNNKLEVNEASYNVYFPPMSSFIIGRQDIRKLSNNNTGIKSTIGFALSPFFEPIITVPIELIGWKTEIENDNDVRLSWSTVSEVNNDYFEVEHSLDGVNFKALAVIKGAGTSIKTHYYDYKIKNLQEGDHYFRLKQVDFDGTVQYSSIKVERIKENVAQIIVYPSVLHKESALYLQTIQSGVYRIEMYTMEGQLLHSSHQNLMPFEANPLMVDLSNYKSGIYILKVGNKALNHIAKIHLH